MQRLLITVLAPLAALSFAMPAAASTTAVARSAPAGAAFGVAPLADANLAEVHGTGLARPDYLRRAARDEFESINRLTGETLPVTFDNWFADIGDALIISNQVR